MRILVTGGLGFIGSAVAAAAIARGHEVAILDNASTSRLSVRRRIAAVAGREPTVHIGDVRDGEAVLTALGGNTDAVVHCAGLKSIGESLTTPLEYYDVNVAGTVRLLQAMADAGCPRIVFSSSATVYGVPATVPITEDAPTGAGLTNPYGRTKNIAETVLADACAANPALSATILRYFNPIGAHASGLLGEDPAGTPTNIFPLIAQTAAGTRHDLTITGTDYPTPDGTGIRDYIHITDLAEGHLAALDTSATGVRVYNLGTGRGTSVRELITAYADASGRAIPAATGPRRPGDVTTCFADPAKAQRELGWSATRTVADACRDSWAWQQELQRSAQH